jgi:hypothetical protein
MPMHILMRTISPYTWPDLLLGVFRTIADAEAGRREYLEKVLHGPADPWAEQAYHSVSDDDSKVLSTVRQIELGDDCRHVFVVSSYADGFGQADRRIEGIAGSSAAAERLEADLIEAATEDTWPFECVIDEVPVGLLSLHADGYQSYKKRNWRTS